MMKLAPRWHVRTLIRVACYLALMALVLMIWSVLTPRALPVVIGMSVGQGVGVLALLCYLLAIFTDVSRAPKGAKTASEPQSVRPPPPPPRRGNQPGETSSSSGSAKTKSA